MKKIWIINHYIKIGEGRHYKFAEELTKRGYKVNLICASTSVPKEKIENTNLKINKLTYNNVDYTIVKAREYFGNGKERIKNMLEFSIRSYRYLKKSKEIPDVIYASSVHPLAWGVGYLLSKKFKVRFVVETRDLWPETLIQMKRIKKNSLPAKVLYKFEEYIYKRADALIFTMPLGEDYVKERGIPTKKIYHINNGIDLSEFNNNVNKYPYTGLKSTDKFIVTYTGSLGVANAMFDIVNLGMELQKRKVEDVEIHIYGDGYLKESIETYIEENKIENVILHGKVEKKYIPSILRNSDLNIMTSQNISIYKYGISLNKLFDYFAAGRPIISNIPTPYNKIEKYKAGITVSPGNIEALTETIIRLKEIEDEEYRFYCVNSKKAASFFSYKNLVNDLEKIL